MINILVTGGNGQLASCINDLDTEKDGFNFIYTDYQDLDICDFNQVQSFFSCNKIDYCINCAAYTAVDKAEEEKEMAFAINASGAKNMALACKEHNTILIHISTDFVFDGKKSEPYLEIDTANPISVYGASKLQGEIEVQNILKKHYIIRTSWLYSEHGNNFMKTMLHLAETRDEISVVSDQIGAPTYAGDLAAAILQIINNKQEVDFGVYHYSNEGVASWYDFAKAIFRCSCQNIEVNSITAAHYPLPAKRPKYSVLNTKKIKHQFHVDIPNWYDSLEACVESFLHK